MNIPDELLAAYLDGELEEAERARIEQAVQQDSRIAQRLARQRAQRSRARTGLAALRRVPGARRFALSSRSVAATGSAQIIDLARVRAERKRRTERSRSALSRRLIMIAGVAAGVLFGVVIDRFTASGALTQYRDGAIFARGPLADALNAQLGNSPMIGNSVRVGLSFRSKSGGVCRTFAVRDAHALTGLACRELDQWRVLALDGTESRGGGAVRGRTVSSLSPAVAQAVNDRISGSLDAQGEIKARSNGWR